MMLFDNDSMGLGVAKSIAGVFHNLKPSTKSCIANVSKDIKSKIDLIDKISCFSYTLC